MSSNDDMDRNISGEIRLLLDEKMTFVSIMNTGIVVLIAQLLILSILISTSQFYKLVEVLHLVIPLCFINIILAVLSFYLIIHSLWRIHHFNRLIYRLKKKHSLLSDLFDA